MIRVTRPTNDKRDGFSVWACSDGKARLDHKNLHVDSLKLYETAQKNLSSSCIYQVRFFWFSSVEQLKRPLQNASNNFSYT